MQELLEWALILLGGCFAGLLYLGGLTWWERMKPDPPANFTLTLMDGDNIPVKQQKMTAKGAGRIITELNINPNFYK